MAKSVRRIQSQKVQTPRSKKTRDYRNGNDFSNFKGPRYSRKAKYNTEW
ncbi:hypothetical protein SEA_ANNADREAMY_242 [Streptomyces phage Annadreamy]|uniref:Uncharacterized protein n=2 Tax=Annadreamyvirus annadreamy TaxID=2846392 RepID=A0A345GTQ0_9CAUD|nr:hypothetical protein HWB75_gp037 [Streptomyces phage Annadreamy]AXG66322.1 hypothetical protein SEA_ANNADREAMY_242 [Streptomyces phage Annadreamy]QGH79549.1 hypothetical protein SEA_LIMPID_248 [Streptomyces phage Limpid]